MSATPPALDDDPSRAGSRGRILFTFAVGVLVGAGLTAGLFLGFGGAPGAAPTPPTPGSAVTAPAEPAPAGHAVHRSADRSGS